MNDHLWLTYEDTEKIKIASNTIVVRMEALRAKYAGGLQAFFKLYGVRCNRQIAIMCSMNDLDINDFAEDLERHGLIGQEDYTLIEADIEWMMWDLAKRNGFPPEKIEVDWLEADIRKDGYWVSYKG